MAELLASMRIPRKEVLDDVPALHANSAILVDAREVRLMCGFYDSLWMLQSQP
jgi:hypothetical protein